MKIFILLEKLGEGSSGDVFLFYNKRDKNKKKYVIKIFRPNIDEHAMFYAKREYEILKYCNNKNITFVPKVFNFITLTDNHLFFNLENKYTFFLNCPSIIMEFCKGDKMDKYIMDVDNINNTRENRVNICKKLRKYVEKIHNLNIAHGDLFMKNIILSENFKNIYIIDWAFGSLKIGLKSDMNYIKFKWLKWDNVKKRDLNGYIDICPYKERGGLECIITDILNI